MEEFLLINLPITRPQGSLFVRVDHHCQLRLKKKTAVFKGRCEENLERVLHNEME